MNAPRRPRRAPVPCARPGPFVLAVFFSFALAGAVLLPAADVLASSSRVRSLGGDSGYFEDDSNVLRWYGSVVDYPDLVVAELGRFDLDAATAVPWSDRVYGQGGGLHLSFDAARRWGVGAAYVEGDQPDDIPGGAATLMWGRSFGRHAVALAFQGTSYNRSTAGDGTQLFGRAEYHHVWGAGLRSDLGESAYLDLAADVRNTQFDYVDPFRGLRYGPVEITKGWSARARLFWRPNPRVVLVPLIGHLADIRPTYSDVLEDAADLDARITRVGFGVNLLPDADNLVLFSFEYAEGEETLRGQASPFARYARETRDWFTLHGRIGAESRVLAWLTVRLGIEYLRIEDEVLLLLPAVNGDDLWFARRDIFLETPVNLGLGLHFGSFTADLVVNEESPFNLGYALTGAGRDDSTTFTSITLSYGF
ncbi:MAG: hypothetical protein R6X25_03055 [Candidatus Krumholzibacteriia bacterium]